MEAQGHLPPICKYSSCGIGEPSQKAQDTSIQEAEFLKICPHQQNDSTVCRDWALPRAAKKSAFPFLAKYD